MKNRIPNPAIERAPFGLIAWLEATRVILPLKGVECVFNVCGEVVNVEIDQIFEQNNRQPLDCLYSFPLPAGAAVYRCEMHVNGRVIRARVEERERAREIAQEKKAAGYRTALVEMERDNLFTLSLGNLQPGDLVVIRFAYFQTITRLADWASFRVPFCPGVRFIPGTRLLRSPKGQGTETDTDQVPDASRISPPRIDRLHPDAAYLSVAGTVEHSPETTGLSSPTHPILVKPAARSSTVTVTLADQGSVPDSDFIVRWTEPVAERVMTAGWITRHEADTFAIVRFRAPEHAAASETYAQDFYFLVDRSGSMGGLKWQKAVESFRAFVNLLGPKDRLWASFFDDHVQDLSDKPEFSAAIKADRQFNRLEALGTGGGTQLLPALDHVLAKIAAHSAGRPSCLILITDGEVGNEAEILKRLAPSLRIHVFGIDVTINDGFLQKLAAQHDGSSCLLSPGDDIVGAVSRLGNRLRRPVLTGLRVSEGWETATEEARDLYAGDVVSLVLKRRANDETQFMMEAKQLDGTPWSCRFDLVAAEAVAVPLLWAKRRIDLLLAQGKQVEAIALAKQNNIVCEGAAFIAWDETEEVPVSSRELYQPAVESADIGTVCRFTDTSFAPSRMIGAEYKRRLKDDSAAASVMRAREIPPLSPELSRHLKMLGMDSNAERGSLLKRPAGILFLDCIKEWVKTDDEHVPKVEELLVLLKAGFQKLSVELLDQIADWVRRELPQPFKDRALKALVEMRAELLKQVAPS